ncbi:MAG: hypothetical protein H6699_11565 [Myxococcales bacterium]|nr:hypothetical protein [Myxococcales bacterium]
MRRTPRLALAVVLCLAACRSHAVDAPEPPSAPAVASPTPTTQAPPSPLVAAPVELPLATADAEGSGDIAPVPEMPIADGAMTLAPRYRRGQTIGLKILWSQGSTVSVSVDGADVGAAVDVSVDADLELRVLEADKGLLRRVSVRFDSVAARVAGSVSTSIPAPESGATWECVVAPSWSCTSAGAAVEVPPWLPLSLEPLMPSRRVVPGERWSRSVGVAQALGMGTTAIARAELVAEAPYDTGTTLLSTVQLTVRGSDRSSALGRSVDLTLDGGGAIDIDLRRQRVVGFDTEWTARGSTVAGDALTARRVVHTSLRVRRREG